MKLKLRLSPGLVRRLPCSLATTGATLDFALPRKMIGTELDGQPHPPGMAAIAADRRRPA